MIEQLLVLYKYWLNNQKKLADKKSLHICLFVFSPSLFFGYHMKKIGLGGGWALSVPETIEGHSTALVLLHHFSNLATSKMAASGGDSKVLTNEQPTLKTSLWFFFGDEPSLGSLVTAVLLTLQNQCASCYSRVQLQVEKWSDKFLARNSLWDWTESIHWLVADVITTLGVVLMTSTLFRPFWCLHATSLTGWKLAWSHRLLPCSSLRFMRSWPAWMTPCLSKASLIDN